MAGKIKLVKDTTDRWLLTYSDLMNLLLIFFIILYSMSQVDAEKFNKLAASLREEFGSSQIGTYIGNTGTSNSIIDLNEGSSSTVIPDNLEQRQMEEVKERVEALIKEKGFKDQVRVSVKERGVEISMQENLLFKSGSAAYEPSAKATLTEIGKIIKSLSGNQIRVEGHTDNDPINTELFPSNWELSSVRATNVVRTLIDIAGLNPLKISAIGYGEFRPKAPNTTADNKRKNRRVDIIIVKSSFNIGEAGIM
ncbi:OmpA family protein [Pseudobacteroides cellulosolvens]|uniref:OmpA/MotB domain protein n=1 Tax=Pseudobacteroides cellulosolvens ATCC 35603 = DSM 2933 TaxID=398512 RepID=A0A0L6JSW4_9FIRM|nr:OmpA family protein [Pseudobacteroides cellulosolvens]KNY28517.1 OmpA/MotB domain protein [Pseudobacteroides cellulosolvens ATCC 35603 = DSM 2933]